MWGSADETAFERPGCARAVRCDNGAPSSKGRGGSRGGSGCGGTRSLLMVMAMLSHQAGAHDCNPGSIKVWSYEQVFAPCASGKSVGSAAECATAAVSLALSDTTVMVDTHRRRRRTYDTKLRRGRPPARVHGLRPSDQGRMQWWRLLHSVICG